MTYTDLLAGFASFYKDTTGEDLSPSFDNLHDEGASVLKTEKLENGNVRITMGCTEEVSSRDDLGNRYPRIFSWKEITEWTTDEDNEPYENVKTEYERI